METTYLSIKADHIKEFEKFLHEFDMKILDVEQSKTAYIWVKIGYNIGTSCNLYLLGLRVGGLMTMETIDKIK